MSTFILKRKQETKSEAKQRDTTDKFHPFFLRPALRGSD